MESSFYIRSNEGPLKSWPGVSLRGFAFDSGMVMKMYSKSNAQVWNVVFDQLYPGSFVYRLVSYGLTCRNPQQSNIRLWQELCLLF
jgi:hypothetical protein